MSSCIGTVPFPAAGAEIGFRFPVQRLAVVFTTRPERTVARQWTHAHVSESSGMEASARIRREAEGASKWESAEEINRRMRERWWDDRPLFCDRRAATAVIGCDREKMPNYEDDWQVLLCIGRNFFTLFWS
jgi:hypothetical protein